MEMRRPIDLAPRPFDSLQKTVVGCLSNGTFICRSGKLYPAVQAGFKDPIIGKSVLDDGTRGTPWGTPR